MKIDNSSGLVIEELRNGFLGREVTYFLWHGKRLIATSIDRKNWKMASWANKVSDTSLKQIDEGLFKGLSQTGDV